MSENIQSISQGTFTIGQTSATNFQAGPGISITQPSEGTVRIANDETVIYDNGNSTSATCSEATSNFERIKIFYNRGDNSFIQEFPGSPGDNIIQLYCGGAFTNGYVSLFNFRYEVSGTNIIPTNYLKETFGNNTLTIRNASAPTILKIIGINRISGSNA